MLPIFPRIFDPPLCLLKVNLVTSAKPLRFDYTELYGAIGHECVTEVFWPALGSVFNLLRSKISVFKAFLENHLGEKYHSARFIEHFLVARLQPCLSDAQAERFIRHVLGSAKDSQDVWLKDKLRGSGGGIRAA